MTSPVTLVLDDVHLLHNSECRAALSVLADHVPAGSRLVLAGRAEPPLRIARLRAEGRILEIGPGDLSLTREEASSLLRAAEVRLGEDEWPSCTGGPRGGPAGLYLAALYLREGGSLPGTAASFGGDDRFVSEYVESEFLARISRRQRAFLTRTAVLERMSGPLCEAVLDLPGSGAVLAELARSNLLLVPLDRRGQWYRYHHLFRDMLLRRAGTRWSPAWSRYCAAAPPAGASATTCPRMRWSTPWPPGTSRRPPGWWKSSAVRPTGKPGSPRFSGGSGGWMTGAGWRDTRWPPYGPRSPPPSRDGRPRPSGGPMRSIAGCTRTRRGPLTPSLRRWPIALRYTLCRDGVEQMRADADEAVHSGRRRARMQPTVPAAQGIARILSGDLDGGDAFLEEAVRIGERGAPDVLVRALCQRALVAMDTPSMGPGRGPGQPGTLGSAAGRDREVLLLCAVQARLALHRGDVAAARRELVSAQRLRPLLTYAHAPPGRPDPDRAHPRPPRPRRPGRGQDAHAGSR